MGSEKAGKSGHERRRDGLEFRYHPGKSHLRKTHLRGRDGPQLTSFSHVQRGGNIEAARVDG